ncbi:hypothetical protein IWQ61_007390 [Dispira simplex]|nr:hypothetical protein IWQ61_007390 [Dispira simplex]
MHQCAYNLEADDGYHHMRIIFTNDIHAHEKEFNPLGTDCTEHDYKIHTCYGGAGRRKTIINRLRAGYRSLLFDAGDVFQGHPIHNYYRGNASAIIMNSQRYDAMTIGNHEFDHGLEHLANFFEKINFPVICTNLRFSSTSRLANLVKKHLYFEDYNIAVVGVTTTTTQFISLGEGLDQVKFLDPVEAVQAEIDIIQEKYPGILAIFMLSHNGYLHDQALANQVSGLSFIFGGHSHTYLSTDHPNDPDSKGPFPTVVMGRDNKPVYIVQAKKYGEYVGFVDLTLNQEGRIEWLSGQPIHMSDKIPQDPDMQELVNILDEPLHQIDNINLGVATIDMVQEVCKTGECYLANFVTDTLKKNYKDFNPDIVLINSDGMRAGIRQGTVKPTHMWTVFPMDDQLVQMKLTGQQIYDILQGSITGISPTNGKSVTCFVHFSGLKVEFNFHKKHLGKVYTPVSTQVMEMDRASPHPGWVELDLRKTFSVITFYYIAEGGDNIIGEPVDYTMLPGNILSVMMTHAYNNKELSPALDERYLNVDP